MHFKTTLAGHTTNYNGLPNNHSETLVAERPRRLTRRLATGLSAGLLALVLLTGVASQAELFPPGPTKTTSALIRAITVNLQPCL
jgi:hypothetical protein